MMPENSSSTIDLVPITFTAVNVIGTKSIVLLLFSGIIFGQLDMFVDIALGYGLLNFIVSIAASRYYQHRRSLEQKGQPS